MKPPDTITLTIAQHDAMCAAAWTGPVSNHDAWENGYGTGYNDRERTDHDRADVIKSPNPYPQISSGSAGTGAGNHPEVAIPEASFWKPAQPGETIYAALRRQCSGPNPEEEGKSGLTCNRCGGGYSVEIEDEPSGLCHYCAQAICGQVPELLDRIAELETLAAVVNEGVASAIATLHKVEPQP